MKDTAGRISVSSLLRTLISSCRLFISLLIVPGGAFALPSGSGLPFIEGGDRVSLVKVLVCSILGNLYIDHTVG